MIFTQNFCAISNLVASTEVKEYIAIHDKTILTDFTKFDFSLSNSHIGTNISSSKIDFYRKTVNNDSSLERVKLIYSLPQNFSCYNFDFEMKFAMNYTDLHQVGIFELQFSSYYDPYTIATLNLATISRFLVIGRPYRSSVGFQIGRWFSREDSDDAVKEYTSNIPKSVLFWGNRTSINETELSIDKYGTKTRVVNRDFQFSNINNLSYISIGYTPYEYDDYFNVTISNLNIVLYSTEEKYVLDLNSSKNTNFSKVIGLTLPVIVILNLFLGVGIIVIRKKRE